MRSSHEVTAVVLCAGKGVRAGLGYNKLLHYCGDVTIAARTALKLARFDRLVVVINPDDEEKMRAFLGGVRAEFVYGGDTRTQSVRNALRAIGHTDIVMIHDGARPFVSDETLDASVRSAIEYGSGIAAVPSKNALKIVRSGEAETLDRGSVYVIQTPQTFRFDELAEAYARVDGVFADDSEVYELGGRKSRLVPGSPDNVKLTDYRDLAGLNEAYRIGFGYDVHRVEPGRKLVLCGAKFDTDYGLLGHSDADAPVHALMDAILGAAGLPDIGVLFPDTDPRYEGADSMALLASVMQKASAFEVINASVCIMAQKPKIAPRVPEMRALLAAALNVGVDCVNVSATTTEGLGIVGEGKGIAAAANVLLRLR